MPNFLTIIVIALLIITGSSILLIAIFGGRLMTLKGKVKLEVVRRKYNTLLLTIGVLLLLGAFSIIAFSGNGSSNQWTSEEKEQMVRKIMESSIFVHGIGADTARLVSECFIEKYTASYTHEQMKEQNKMSNEEISKLTSKFMIDCLKKYGLPKINTTPFDHGQIQSSAKQMHL
jgi:hypothetical protein